jgi:hypothetical protein
VDEGWKREATQEAGETGEFRVKQGKFRVKQESQEKLPKLCHHVTQTPHSHSRHFSDHMRICSCGCNRIVSRATVWCHGHNGISSPRVPSPKRRRITHSRADANSSSSDHSQLHAPSFEFNSPLPSLDPSPASNLHQSPGDARTQASGCFANDVLLNLHAKTHRTTDQSDDEDTEDAADSVYHETDDYWNEEDIAMEGDVDPREGIVSDWDLLAEEFIVEAEELGEFEPSLLHTP